MNKVTNKPQSENKPIKKLAPVKGRTGARKCWDKKGNAYASLLEFQVCHEFMDYERQGYIKDFNMQIPFNFQNIKVTATYIADFGFTCLKDFSIKVLMKTSKKEKIINFKSGEQYVCDAKSTWTVKDPVYSIKKKLMKAAYGIDLIEVIRKPPSLTYLIANYDVLFEPPK